MNKNKISVVTVVYNGAEIIENTILSVINQTYENLEYIIIDGNSKDGTQELIKKYEDKIHFWSSEPDKGIYDAMNKAISIATGDYIIFMNCGDQFYNVDVIKNIFSGDSKEDLIYGDTVLDNKGKTQLSKAKEFKEIKYGMPFCHQSVFVKLSIMKKSGFNLKYKLASDYDFFLSLFYCGIYSYKKIHEFVSIYDNCGVSMSLKTIEEKFTISKHYYPSSKVSAFHYYQLKYYTFTSFLKKVLPKSLAGALINIKRKL